MTKVCNGLNIPENRHRVLRVRIPIPRFLQNSGNSGRSSLFSKFCIELRLYKSFEAHPHTTCNNRSRISVNQAQTFRKEESESDLHQILARSDAMGTYPGGVLFGDEY